ncbi:MAG: hypothetical protein WBP93_04045 [Pyrinomonadaceae bacterium]
MLRAVASDASVSVFGRDLTGFGVVEDISGAATLLLPESSPRPFIKATVTATETAAVANNPTIRRTTESCRGDLTEAPVIGFKGRVGAAGSASRTDGTGEGYELGAGDGEEPAVVTGSPQSKQNFWSD